MIVKKMLAIALLFGAGGQALSQSLIPASGYLCSNLRYGKSYLGNTGSEANWGEYRNMIPLGTKATLGPYYGNSNSGTVGEVLKPHIYVLRANQLEIVIKHDFTPKQNLKSFIARFLCADDPTPRFTAMPEEIKQVIASGKVQVGMTKEQVVLSMGMPYPDEPRDLKDDYWIYYWGSFDKIGVTFGENGRVQTVKGANFALADMLEAPPTKNTSSSNNSTAPKAVVIPYTPTPFEDASRLVNLDQRGKDGYKTWQQKPLPRAFAIQVSGSRWASSWNWAPNSGHQSKTVEDVKASALERCSKNGEFECRIYAIDNQLVP